MAFPACLYTEAPPVRGAGPGVLREGVPRDPQDEGGTGEARGARRRRTAEAGEGAG